MSRGARNTLTAIGALFGLLVVVYGPTFAALAAFRPSMRLAVPMVILLSLNVAVILVLGLLLGGRYRVRDFGFSLPRWREAVVATGLAVPLAVAVAAGGALLGAKNPLHEHILPLWAVILCFWIGASIQEEVIFRGLVQTVVARRVPQELRLRATRLRLSAATVMVAVAFALLHLPVDLWAGVGALILGLLAGELRQRSGSLVPAVLVHAVFNVAATVQAHPGWWR